MEKYRPTALASTAAFSVARGDGALFPVVLAGLLGLWGLGALALSCPSTLTSAEVETLQPRQYVSCQPAEDRAPGQLLRCIVETPAQRPRDI
ncbi:MAG: hypothetical protein QF578_15690 [Alphaproteobacteria bacterium]|jgi:hypothetical protein|nr:hypothetical protein [Alphaproteobacteria bacterium]MDP6566270.1 hypothetical protein [Alphaproteobacteria bacterium]MDP6813709.1 hypothetical protein [Alphaproteobacteria bacterium]